MKRGAASGTAKVIAAATILLANDSRSAHLVARGAAELCAKMLSLSRADRWLARSVAYPVMRALWRTMERLTHPGIVAHYWHRKRWIETRCRSAIGAGYERVIVVGAGLDTLGFRLTLELPALEVLEIDHPATQTLKRRALGKDALRFVALDLSTEPLPGPLAQVRKATVVIMEGLLMYLPLPAIDRLFASLRSLSSERVCVIFSFMTRWPDGSAGFRPRSWLVERWLAAGGEPFNWAIEPARIDAFLSARGFRLEELALTRNLAVEPTVLDGENLVLCVRDESRIESAAPAA